MTSGRSGEVRSRTAMLPSCVYFITVLVVYIILIYVNNTILHSFMFFSAISAVFLVLILSSAFRAIRASKYYRVDRSQVKSGKTSRFYFTLIVSILNSFVAISPFLLFMISLDASIQLYDYTRGDAILGVSMLLLFLFGSISGVSVFRIQEGADFVEYGLQEEWKLGYSSFIFNGMVLITNMVIVIYYVLNGFYEAFFFFGGIGTLMSVLLMVGLVSIAKEGSVKQVYDIPWWSEFCEAIKEFNRINRVGLYCTFTHRITIERPPQDIFNEVMISFVKRRQTALAILSVGSPGGGTVTPTMVCKFWRTSDNSWYIIIQGDEDIASNLKRFMEHKFNVSIEPVEQKSDFVKNIGNSSVVHKTITI